MADFAFESDPVKPAEEDPAAEFLAREQNELAGLEDDSFGVDNGAQQPQDDMDPLAQPASNQELWGEDSQKQSDTDLFGQPVTTDAANTSSGLLDFGGETTNFNLEQAELTEATDPTGSGLFDGGVETTPSTDNFGEAAVTDVQSNELGDGFLDTGSSSPVTVTTNGPSDAYSAISFQDRERAVPEKILAWRAEQEIRLSKKDAEEEEKKQEWAEAAKKELEDWYKHHTEQVEKTKDNNRAAEEVFVKERDETEPGGEWEKICRLCEFNPKNSKNVKDVSRMRSILLQLKQTPLVR